ncbi:MAG: hypothetical protein GXX96_09970 [Planctomycetaceae bacterium]|nr:hypothetical protein [Planctomycetaceae bacterium]
MAGEWRRCSRRFPCRICGKSDWCGYTGPEDDPTAALCMRVESDKPAKNGGWLHILRDDGPTWAPWKRTYHVAAKRLAPEPAALDFAKLAEAAAVVKAFVEAGR